METKSEKDIELPKVILVHSYNADTLDSFGIGLSDFCSKSGIDYAAPNFPTRNEASYANWKRIMDDAVITKNTIIVAHSLGTQFVPKYIAEKGVEILGYISVAGFVNYAGRKDLEKILTTFATSDEEYEKFIELAKYRFSIYSDNDELNSVEKLERYSEKINATKVLVPGGGHFNPQSGVRNIDALNEILNSLVRETEK